MAENSDKSARLRALQERFIQELPARIADIEGRWQDYARSGGKDDPGELHRSAHSLAGSAGTFGFGRLGARARELELLIQKSNGELTQQGLAAIEQAIGDLRALAMRGPDKANAMEELPPSPAGGGGDRGYSLVYVLEDDAGLAEEITRQLHHFGYRGETYHSAKALKTRVHERIPDALVADIYLPEGGRAGTGVVEELRSGAGSEVPVIFISARDGWEDRLSAIRAGGRAYLPKPLNFSLLVEQLDMVTGNRQEANYRILIVDDTPLLAQHYAAVLQAAGMQTQVVNDPARLLDVLPTFNPDLILMDVYMPGCTGVEAAQVIRQHPAYTSLPIVYMSTEKGLQLQLETLRVGGDDFLQKPIGDAHLVAAVRSRARRFREQSALMNCDGLTGLLNYINLKLALEREIAQTQRRGSRFSFAMLDIDRFKAVNDSYGHPVGDRVIKSLARLLSQRLRKGDIAARYGGEEFALILPDTDLREAMALLDDLRQQFSEITHLHGSGEFTATFSAGIASCPPHAGLDTLIAAADNALYQAKHGGRNQVVVDAAGL